MGAFHELAVRHNNFVKNIDSYVEGAVDDNNALLDLNREQLNEEHKNKLDQPITPPYSYLTAQIKGFKTPNLYDTGELFDSLTIEAKGKSYFVKGHTDYTPKLLEKYGKDIFGIAKSKQPAAKKITTKELANAYKQSVFNK